MEFSDLKHDYNLYRNFYAVAKTGSFSFAANALFITQPSVSYNIKKLEDNLGLKLFFRNGKTISLTPEGKKLYKNIESAHNTLLFAEKSINESATLMYGEISIGVQTHIASFYLVPIIKIFHEKYPKIKLNILSKSTSEMLEMMNNHALDLIVDDLPIKINDEDIKLKFLDFAEGCFAGIPELIKKNRNYEDYPYILPNAYTSTRKNLNKYFEEIDCKINSIMDISTTEITLALVLQGLGIGYFYKPSIDSFLSEGKLIELKFAKPMPKKELCYVYNDKFISFATKKFIDIIEEANEKSKTNFKS